jgi:hypothetical protein
MSDELVVFVNSGRQKNELEKKYPNVKAEFININGETDTEPVVCVTRNGKDRCEKGEEYIDILSKEL